MPVGREVACCLCRDSRSFRQHSRGESRACLMDSRAAPCLCMEYSTAVTGSAFGEAGLKRVNLRSASGVAPSLWLQIAVLN